MKKIKEYLRKLNNKYWIITILSLLIIIGALLIFKSPTLFWDEGVYINNAKSIYSFGEHAKYESLRPPLLPLIIGLSIPLGINIVIFSKIFIFLCYILALIFIYLISEKIFKNSGIYSATILATTPLVFFVLPHILTDFVVLTFMLIAFYFFINKKYFLAGLFCGISVLLRFPAGLLAIIFGIFLLEKNIKRTLKNGLLFTLGVLLLIVPYLITNKIFFGSFLKPIINAQLIVAQGGNNLLSSFFILIKVLFNQNLILIFLIIFIILIILKKIKDKNGYLLITICAFYFLYFLRLPHFEDRYILLLIPFGAIIGGIIISYILSKIKTKIPLDTVIYITIAFLLVFLLFNNIRNYKNQNYTTEKEISFLKEIGKIEDERIFIYDPITAIYFKGKINYVVNPYYTNLHFEWHPDVNYMVISEKLFDCSVVCMDCDDADQCLELERLENTLDENWQIEKTEKLYGTNYYIYSKK